jgi:peroxiredoxin 5
MVKAGDSIPNIDLFEDSPGNTVNLAKELTGNGVIIGVPAAFSMSNIVIVESELIKLGPSCSDSHVPGYINHPKLKGAGKVFIVSVNDPFV